MISKKMIPLARIRKMKQPVLIILVISIIVVTAGCEPQSYTYRYRPGSMYEYNKLIEAWIPESGTEPPLPPASDPSKSGWVMVPSPNYEYQSNSYFRGRIPKYNSYYRPSILYIDDWFYDDWFWLGFGSYSGWHGRSHHRYHSGLYYRPFYRGHRWR